MGAGERELAVVVKVVEAEEAVGVETWTKGITRPEEFRTRVAGQMRPLGSITGICSGSKVW